MPRPTKEQLRKINKFTQTELDADQVYVFTSLSADTLPVERFGWFGKYNIFMNSSMLNKLKKDYKNGVGLLASHNNNRLPFGRTFNAEVKVDHVKGEPVETMYIDHYVVTHTKDEEGNKIPLQTEIGMTTQDIVNHIDVGHTFDTSIGFAITEPTCSICKNDIRDYEKCSHVPGVEYDVQVGDEVEKQRCDIVANSGEGLENSLVYAGAVDRAIIQNQKFSQSTEDNDEGLQSVVNSGETSLYNVDEIKSLPMNAEIYCRMSKGNLEMFTTTSERKDIKHLKGSEEMATENKTVEPAETVEKAEFEAKVAEVEQLSTKVTELESTKAEFEVKIAELETKLASANEQVVELTAKSELADKFTEDLVSETVKAGVQARGNGFNSERYEKYAKTLSVDELKEELQAFRNEFPGSVEEARVTATEVEPKDEGTVEMSKAEMRQVAAKNAFARYNAEGGNLEELTKEEFGKLLKTSK